MENKIKLYLDTSVYGGFYDLEFAEVTKALFEKINKGEFLVFYSEIVEKELSKAPEIVRNIFNKIPKEYKLELEITREVNSLARAYINEKAVGETSYEDCRHIAMSSIYNIDVLVSWNFKHIVNLKRIKDYNRINKVYGYNYLEIRTPNELIYGTV
ncbi:MAG: type II toxin-antitoxin system VapC family toxin [Dysgonamonadaceae bacterium]|jgi:hypothetical protein|nr:type II toxin-antitoxin system VapC family toxin [Dysgonamonadaceae bacterium]